MNEHEQPNHPRNHRTGQPEPKERSRSMNLSNPSGGAPDRNYDEQMFLVVHDACRFAGQFHVTVEEIWAAAHVWSEILYGIIPADRLRDAWIEAVRAHESSFMVNGYDLKAAWTRIEIRESAERARYLEAQRAANPIAHCPMAHEHADDAGNIWIVNVFDVDGGDVLAPCLKCRPNDYREWSVEHKRQNAEKPNRFSAMIIDMASRKTIKNEVKK